MDKKRLSVQMDKELKLWCEFQANEYGLTVNGFINMVLVNLKKRSSIEN